MSVVLETARLRLRPLVCEDAPRLAALVGDWEVSRMLTRVPHPYGVDDAERFIDRARSREPLHWGVFAPDGLVGCVGVEDHLGYWFGRDFWGRGYATEAAAAVLPVALERAGSVASGAFVENAASRRVLVKLGFVETGRSMRTSLARGCEVEHVDMVLTREAWADRTVAGPAA